LVFALSSFILTDYYLSLSEALYAHGDLVFKSKELSSLLEEELKKGNQVAENSSWPPNCETLIILNDRFIRKYECNNLVYREIKDSHY